MTIDVLGRAGLWGSGRAFHQASVLIGPTVGAAEPVSAPNCYRPTGPGMRIREVLRDLVFF